MNLRQNLLAAVALLTLAVAPAWGAPLLVITGQGGNYELRADGLEAVAAMDITIGYDQSTLATPRVNLGGQFASSMMVPNLTVPGIVRVGIINANGMTGSGTLLTLAFSVTGDRAGVFRSLAVTAYNAKGARIPFQTAIQTSDASSSASGAATQPLSSSAAASAATTSPAGGSSASGTSGSTAWPATVTTGTVVPEKSAVQEPPPQEPPAPPAAVPERPQATAEPPSRLEREPEPPKAAPVERKSIIHPSVLGLFKEYQGQKSVAALSSLFARASWAGIRQEPAIAVADGKETVTVTIEMAGSGTQSPNFSLKNARLLGLTSEKSHYLLKILPDAGATEATLTMLTPETFTEIPLVVTPMFDVKRMPGGKLDEASLAAFLKRDGAPRDLNGDGRQDYVDDYIAVANFLRAAPQK